MSGPHTLVSVGPLMFVVLMIADGILLENRQAVEELRDHRKRPPGAVGSA